MYSDEYSQSKIIFKIFKGDVDLIFLNIAKFYLCYIILFLTSFLSILKEILLNALYFIVFM